MATSWYLIASSGPEAGSGFQLTGPSVTVGRTADNDIAIDDNMVSRHQARLDRQGDIYILTDLGSTNGTWVNGHRVSEPMPLRAGDAVRFGKRADFAFSTQPSLRGDETLSGDRTFAGQDMALGHAPVPPMPAAMGSVVCALCGCPNRPGVRFCESCGQPLAVAQEPICPACGARNRPGIRFCENCGRSLIGRPGPVPGRSPVLSQALGLLTSIGGLVLMAALSTLVTRFALPAIMSSVSAPAPTAVTQEQATQLANLYVAGQYPDFMAMQPTVKSALDGGREVFAVGYTRGSAANPNDPLTTLVVLVDAETGRTDLLAPGTSR